MDQKKIRKAFKGKKICVIGDLIYDRFIFGNVNRISPEAPVPVVEVVDEKGALGGAANVANNIKSLTGKPILIGVLGEDLFADEFLKEAKRKGIGCEHVIKVKNYTTVVKTRIIAHKQQVVRIDREKRLSSLGKKVYVEIEEMLKEVIRDCDGVIVSDYAKGLLNMELLEFIGKLCEKSGKVYVVDPKPIHFPYPKATIVTPNRNEASQILNRKIDLQNLKDFCSEILSKTDWKALLMTLGEDGMALLERKGNKFHKIDARLKEVYDVTGAGDTVVATLTMALSSEFSFFDSARLANLSASVVVTKLGTATCSIEELLDLLNEKN